MDWNDKGGGSFAVEDGVYNAVCVGIIDVGTQHSEYNGKPKVRRECIIEWELLDELIEVDDKTVRAKISKFYNQSLNEQATLRKHLKGWRGRDFTAEELEGFDPKNILGKNCILTVSTNKNGKNVIDAVSKWKSEAVPPEGSTTYFMLTGEDNELTFDGKFPDSISEGRVNIIKRSDEYNRWADSLNPEGLDETEGKVPEEFDDDIPF